MGSEMCIRDSFISVSWELHPSPSCLAGLGFGVRFLSSRCLLFLFLLVDVCGGYSLHENSCLFRAGEAVSNDVILSWSLQTEFSDTALWAYPPFLFSLSHVDLLLIWFLWVGSCIRT